MKRLLLTLALFTSTAVFAHGGYWRHDGHGGWGWVAPVVVGGVIGYEMARPPVYTPPVIVSTPPVVVSQPIVQPPYVNTQPLNCGPWTEIRNLDGSITTQRTCQ